MAAGLCLALLGGGSAEAQFIPYFGKNKVKYDNFAWRVYRSPHFQIYYYPEFEQHLGRLASYAESGYQKISSTLKHEIDFPIPLILYKTHSEFEETNLTSGFVPEGALAFTEPGRDRMVVPIDEPPDRLQGLITHELTHVFEFDLIPRSIVQRTVPLWVDEGLADYMRGLWDPLDVMTIRDAAVTEKVPRISRSEFEALSGRDAYNFGHAAFEYIEARFGREGIRQFLYTWRKNLVGGKLDDIYQQAFRMKPEEFDEGYQKWLMERFKPYRDKQRPSDIGKTISPNPDRTSYTQAFGAAGSPSGEMLAVVTGNRSDGEADIILLSARDGSVIGNLTSGYTTRYEDIALNFSARALGRSIAFDPEGDSVAFFARTGKGRSLFLVSVLNGKIKRRYPVGLDEVMSPSFLPDGRHVLFSALREGVSDIWLLDLDSGDYRDLTQDTFYDQDPMPSPDGKLVVYSRRVSGYAKLYSFPLEDPSKKTQLTFGTFEDVTPVFSPDGTKVYYSSDEDDDTFNLRSLDLRTGAVEQLTDALGGIMAPVALKGQVGDRLAFIAYSKGEFNLLLREPADPMKEVDQDVRRVSEDVLDFQPDVVHQVIPENKRRKRLFEGLTLEGRPPLNVGVTSSGDFFGGSQIALTDVLGDQNFVFTALSVREYRTYQGNYLNLGQRFQYGISGFDTTQFYFATPYQFTNGFSRQGALATQRYSGGQLVGQYPLDKYTRLQMTAGVVRIDGKYGDTSLTDACRMQVEDTGIPCAFSNGTFVPVGLSIVHESTRFAGFGPLSGSTYSIGGTVSATGQSRQTAEADLRKYFRLGSTSIVFAARARGFWSSGDSPDIFYFGGNQEMRGYPYLSFSGNKGFFANLELRLPLVNVMATPIGLLGPVRGTLYAGIGGAQYKKEFTPGFDYKFGCKTSSPDCPAVSYVNDPVFGEPVAGFHLVDGRASFGFGLQAFILGYPLHFDWTKLTDLKVVSNTTQFDFWVGFDF
jgi:Tol biopolymer transport system component